MVLIIGCGYVGQRVGELLLNDPSLVVTTRNQERYRLLKKIFPSVMILNTSDEESLSHAMHGHCQLILTMAADSIHDYDVCYKQTMLHLQNALKHNPQITHLVYTSSSSVYGDHAGHVTDEKSLLKATTPQGQILIEAEELLLSLQTPMRKVCIFRVAEIYGPNRDIVQRVKSLQGKKAPGDGSQTANMIHVQDVARALIFALTKPLEGVFNLCDDDPMSRKTLYDLISSRYNLPQVVWDPHLTSLHQGNRLLSNQKLKDAGFVFEFPKRTLAF